VFSLIDIFSYLREMVWAGYRWINDLLNIEFSEGFLVFSQVDILG
jgi:hypothetical protein